MSGERFSVRLVRLRRRCRLKQIELAEVLGVTARTIGHWEQGRWPGHRLGAICTKLAPILGVTPHYLRFGWEESDTRLAARARASWSVPSPELVEEARAGRREIERAEGFKRCAP
jgi:transcriptional regulator with XRE-family HTH domain